MKEIENVLDHGYVRLVGHMGDDLSVVRSARVSYDAAPRGNDDTALIGYLMRNRHTSPFESVNFTFEVKAPIFVFRQWHRHRTWSYNEVSARYTELPEEFYVPERGKIGKQSTDNKQMRVDDELTMGASATILGLIRNSNEASFLAYKGLIASGTPRELARSVLPVGTYSKMFASVDLHNLFHFCKLRLHPHAQYEIRVYAEAMLNLIEPIVPVCVAAWRKHELESTDD